MKLGLELIVKLRLESELGTVQILLFEMLFQCTNHMLFR